MTKGTQVPKLPTSHRNRTLAKSNPSRLPLTRPRKAYPLRLMRVNVNPSFDRRRTPPHPASVNQKATTATRPTRTPRCNPIQTILGTFPPASEAQRSPQPHHVTRKRYLIYLIPLHLETNKMPHVSPVSQQLPTKNLVAFHHYPKRHPQKTSSTDPKQRNVLTRTRKDWATTKC
jgi:hypothetical protein